MQVFTIDISDLCILTHSTGYSTAYFDLNYSIKFIVCFRIEFQCLLTLFIAVFYYRITVVCIDFKVIAHSVVIGIVLLRVSSIQISFSTISKAVNVCIPTLGICTKL